MVRALSSGFALCILLLVGLSIGESNPRSAPDCDEVHKVLEDKRRKLTDYVQALEKFQQQGDMELAWVFSHKISRMIDEIRVLEQTASKCPKPSKSLSEQGIGPAKNDPALYSDKSCDELRTMYVQIVRRAHSLERREHSFLSQLTPEEGAFLAAARQDLKTLEELMKTRCPPDPPKRRRPSAPSVPNLRNSIGR
jgi:hypothetical protein